MVSQSKNSDIENFVVTLDHLSPISPKMKHLKLRYCAVNLEKLESLGEDLRNKPHVFLEKRLFYDKIAQLRHKSVLPMECVNPKAYLYMEVECFFSELPSSRQAQTSQLRPEIIAWSALNLYDI